MGAQIPPSTAGTWFCQVDCPFPDTTSVANVNNSLAFMFKELLKGTSTSGTLGPGGRPASTKWTVVGSCDGATTGSLDGIDRLTGSVPNSYSSASIVHNSSGSAHSWIVLQSPAALGPVYVCIDFNATATTSVGYTYSINPFVNTPAPGTGSRPLTNNGWMAGTTADPTPSTNTGQMTDQNLNTPYRASIAVDASGAFHFIVCRPGVSCSNYYQSCFRTVDSDPNDRTYNIFTGFDTQATFPGSPNWNEMGGSPIRCIGRVQDGSVVASVGGFHLWSFGGTTYGTQTADTSGSVTGSFPCYPPYIWTTVANKNSWRGRVPDVWISGQIPPGAVFSSSVGFTSVQVGNILLPFTAQLTASFSQATLGVSGNLYVPTMVDPAPVNGQTGSLPSEMLHGSAVSIAQANQWSGNPGERPTSGRGTFNRGFNS